VNVFPTPAVLLFRVSMFARIRSHQILAENWRWSLWEISPKCPRISLNCPDPPDLSLSASFQERFSTRMKVNGSWSHILYLASHLVSPTGATGFSDLGFRASFCRLSPPVPRRWSMINEMSNVPDT
jgi:hypothetical protein